jgi:hypothetical protein
MIVVTDTTLQNCQFCGSEARAKSNGDPDATAPTSYGENYWIKC